MTFTVPTSEFHLFSLRFNFETGRTVDPYFCTLGYLVWLFCYGRLMSHTSNPYPMSWEWPVLCVGLADVVLP